jgi:hypothetical protein
MVRRILEGEEELPVALFFAVDNFSKYRRFGA